MEQKPPDQTQQSKSPSVTNVETANCKTRSEDAQVLFSVTDLETSICTVSAEMKHKLQALCSAQETAGCDLAGFFNIQIEFIETKNTVIIVTKRYNYQVIRHGWGENE